MEQGIHYKEQLTSIINDPDGLTILDIPVLKELVNQYPYFQPLRLILAKLSGETEEAEHTLTTTALYTNGAMLHQFLHRKAVNPPQITSIGSSTDSETLFAFEDEHSTQPEEINCVEEVNDHFDTLTSANLLDEQETFEEIAEINIHDYEETSKAIPPPTELPEDETYEEISEIDIHDYDQPVQGKPNVSGAPVIETLEDTFVEHIAATDFFAFEENFSPEEKTEISTPVSNEEKWEESPANRPQQRFPDQSLVRANLPQHTERQTQKDTSEITNYDDDTLPYTFLWWLAKTRKEHSTIFQPYASPKKPQQNELHQQYVEHIFHIQSPFNAEEILNNVPEQQAEPKDALIIDEFIKKDPQITPPRPEQIDNENKAKKSAEDHNDLVSETLAKIYIEQMLYHKAIDTYEKLSLKFPEKSRYFADLIQSIKKKI